MAGRCRNRAVRRIMGKPNGGPKSWKRRLHRTLQFACFTNKQKIGNRLCFHWPHSRSCATHCKHFIKTRRKRKSEKKRSFLMCSTETVKKFRVFGPLGTSRRESRGV